MTKQFSSIQEQGRKQRARYKLFYILTKALLFAGLLSINFLPMPGSIKPKGLISLLVFAVFFALQVVLLSEGFGQKVSPLYKCRRHYGRPLCHSSIVTFDFWLGKCRLLEIQ